MIYASTLEDFDCGTYITPLQQGGEPFKDVSERYAQTILSQLSQEATVLRIFTQRDLTTAMRHLHQACCDGTTTASDCEGIDSLSQHFPESKYLIDHLIDIGMRKLDGVVEHCEAYDIDCTMPDTRIRSQQWREEITRIAEDREWHPPAAIDELFRKYRWDKQAIIADASNPDGNVLLANAYSLMCNEVQAIFDQKPWTIVDPENTAKGVCQIIANTRYDQEVSYVRTLLVEKWIDYLTQHMRSYMMDYLTINRFNSLTDSYVRLEWCMNTVLRYVTNTSCCNEW